MLPERGVGRRKQMVRPEGLPKLGGLGSPRGAAETHRGAGETPRWGETLRGAGEPPGKWGGTLRGAEGGLEGGRVPEGAVGIPKGGGVAPRGGLQRQREGLRGTGGG